MNTMQKVREKYLSKGVFLNSVMYEHYGPMITAVFEKLSYEATNYADENGWFHLRTKYICEHVNITRRIAYYAIGILEKDGFICVKRQNGKIPQYRIIPEKWDNYPNLFGQDATPHKKRLPKSKNGGVDAQTCTLKGQVTPHNFEQPVHSRDRLNTQPVHSRDRYLYTQGTGTCTLKGQVGGQKYLKFYQVGIEKYGCKSPLNHKQSNHIQNNSYTILGGFAAGGVCAQNAPKIKYSNFNFRKQTENQNTQNSPYAAPPQRDGGRMSRRNLKAQKSPNDGSAVQGKFDCPIPDNGNYAPSSKNEIKNPPRPREAQDSPLAPPAPIAALIATLESQPTRAERPQEGTKLKNMGNRKGRGKKREKAQIQRPLENEHKYDFSEYTQDEIRFAKSWFIYASERWLTIRRKGWEGCCYDWLDGIKRVTRGPNALCDFDRLVTLLEWAKTDKFYCKNIRDLSRLDKKWENNEKYMLECLSDEYDDEHQTKPRKTATVNNEKLNIPNEIPTLVHDVLAEAYDPDEEYFDQMCKYFVEGLVPIWELLDKCNAKQPSADKQDWIYGKICLQKLEAIPRLWNQYGKGEQPSYSLYSRWDRFWQKVDKWRDNEIARGKPGIWVMDKLYNYIGGTNGN